MMRGLFNRHRLLATVSAAAMALTASAAHAQDAPPQAADMAEDTAPDITVTGSRIVRDGYNAPTPVSVISTKELKAEAPANISDFVNTLPAVRGSGTAASSNGSLSNGAAGINTVNLRNLGAQRTLVLFDGQRSVTSATTGVVDVNTFPQALIERVEVVTGGASSAYGSDAVSGVVNFILDKKFTGFKSSYEYGVTTYGDGPNHKISFTGGQPFAGGRGHILLSGEYFTQKGIQSIDRDWNDGGFFQIDSPAAIAGTCTKPAGYVAGTPISGCGPARYIGGGIGTSQFTPGGLITGATVTGGAAGGASGAALAAVRGIYFGQIDPLTGKATTNTLQFGQINGQWMIGGDYNTTSQGHRSSATLQPSEKRGSAFGRVSYEFSEAFQLFGQFAYSRYQGQSYYQQTPTTGVTIQRDNAYLPDSVRTAMVNNNLSAIQIGTSNIYLPPQGSDNTRQVYRYVVGGSGDFGLMDTEWHWDGYYQKGVTKTHELLTNAWNLSRMTKATDAVVAQAGNVGGYAPGTIVCRVNVDANLTNDDRACAPLNRIGTNGASSDAISYILYGGLQPLRTQKLQQDVAAFSVSTNNLFELPAGPISLAMGGEYRKEQVSGYVDPLFQPVVSAGVTSGTWIYGNYLPTIGKYDVKEFFVETIVPIFKGMDFNGAFRSTDYSTSGSVNTWKAGLTWQVIDDFKLRGTISQDIRAPNLGELFAPGVGRTNTVNVPVTGGTRTDQFNESTVGNNALVPEVAKTYGGGVIVTPRWLPGLALSVDYYYINLKGAISSLTAQTLVDQCYIQNIASACSFISTTGGRGVTTAGLPVTSIEIKPINFVSIKTKGIDFEASYRREIGPGKMTLRALGTKAISLYTDNGIDAPTEAAGQNSGAGSIPTWTYRLSAGYDMDNGLGFQLIGRGVSGGTYDNSYIVCSTSCPASTVANRTVNMNHIDGAFYLDMNANYSFKISNAKAEAFVAIKNLLNEDPVLVGNGPTGNNTPAYPQTNRALYDVLGRVFRVGFRMAI